MPKGWQREGAPAAVSKDKATNRDKQAILNAKLTCVRPVGGSFFIDNRPVSLWAIIDIWSERLEEPQSGK